MHNPIQNGDMRKSSVGQCFFCFCVSNDYKRQIYSYYRQIYSYYFDQRKLQNGLLIQPHDQNRFKSLCYYKLADVVDCYESLTFHIIIHKMILCRFVNSSF